MLTIGPQVATLLGHAFGALSVQSVAENEPSKITKDGLSSETVVQTIAELTVSLSRRFNSNEVKEAFLSSMNKAVIHYCSFLHQVPEAQRLTVFQNLIEFETDTTKVKAK